MSLSNKVSDYRGYVVDGEVGIEVEVEANGELPSSVRGWRRVVDSSLRGMYNAEYISSEPTTIKNAEEDLRRLYKRFEGCELQKTVRAGVHVHVNVSDLTLKRLYTFMACYLVVEELLTDWCGDGRQGNHFCLRAIDSEIIPVLLSQAIENHSLPPSNGDALKYSAMNITSVGNLGSLEFRQLQTPTTVEPIITWINILDKIKNNSALFRNPKNVMEGFSEGGEQNFIQTLLEEYAPLFLEDKDLHEKVRRGIWASQEIAYCSSWR